MANGHSGKQLRISIMLPTTIPPVPNGGFKVMYQYANHLAARGHQVTVIHPYSTDPPPQLRTLLVGRLCHYLARARVPVVRHSPPWFYINPQVRLTVTPDLRARWVPDADILFITGWQTAECARHYPPRCGLKYYLIHDYEHFMIGDAVVRARIVATFLAGMRNIVTSPAGITMVKSNGGVVHRYIPNGIDLTIFRQLRSLSDPERRSVGFPSRPETFKGTDDAVVALTQVRDEMGADVPIWAFSYRYDGLPAWINQRHGLSDIGLRDALNQTKVFLVPSHFEGWGLPGAEAMACGAALVSTDNGGVHAYAANEETALLCPPRDPSSLAASICRLLRNDDERCRLALNGQRYIQQFTWDRATNVLEEAFFDSWA